MVLLRHGRIICGWIKDLFWAGIYASIIIVFIVQAFKIPSGSMRDALLEGDRILVNKFIFGVKIPWTNIKLPAIRKPKQGDIVVFLYDKEGVKNRKDYVKRLIATGNQKVEIKKGSVLIDGQPATHQKVLSLWYRNAAPYGLEAQPVIVPEDSYYVLGDNSFSSKDSRHWGFVPNHNIIGLAFFRYWPLHRIGFLK